MILRPLWDRVRRALFADPSRLLRRLMLLLFGLSLALALAGAFALARGQVETGVSSLPYLRPILNLVTSVWFYVLLLVFMLRRLLFRLAKQYVSQAADVTGYNAESVEREKYEASSPDGTTRVLVVDDDPLEEIERRIEAALETGEDDTLSLNPDAVRPPDRERSSSSTSWRDRAKGLVPSRRTVVSTIVAGLAVLAWHIAVTVGPDVATIGLTLAELELARSLPSYLGIAVLTALLYWSLTRGASRPEEELGDELSDPWLERYKLARLDLATTIDLGEIGWSLLLPAALTTSLLLLAVQIWVPPWFYPPIFAAGLLVGLLNYARINWLRSRRLSSVRADDETVEFAELSVLVKSVDVPERTTYYAWVAERRYAHDDREEFIQGVASRAFQVVNGVPVSPSIMEKQAEQLRKARPDLHGFRDNEKYRIMTWLLERVEDAQYGLVPKPALIEDCVEHDITQRGLGPLTWESGKGYDPDFVREAYRELVPSALVEQEIELEGEDASITAVRIRDDPLPPEFGQIQAQFGSQFGGYARAEPLYELPDVSKQLEEEPIYRGSLGGSRA